MLIKQVNKNSFIGFNSIQQDASWYSAYIQWYLNRNQEPLILSYKDVDQELVLPLMLSKERKGLVPEIVVNILGEGPSDFYQPLHSGFSKEILVRKAFELLTNSYWDKLELFNLVEGSFPFENLNELFNQEGYKSEFSEMPGFYFSKTEGSFADYFEEFFRPRNKDLLKDLRKLEREGVELHVQKVKKKIYPELERVLHLYKQRRSSLGQFDKYSEGARRNFVAEILDSYEKTGETELSLLKDQQENVWAFQLDFIKHGTRYHWNHAYNEEFKKFSPGKILLFRLLEESFKDGSIKAVNHMRGAAGYKNKFADQYSPLYSLRVVNPNSRNNKLRKVYFNLSKVKKALTP